MSSEIAIYTGCMDDHNKIHIEWFNHNGEKKHTILEVNIQPQDKPRKLDIIVNGVKVVEVM